ncbi:MAG TPA: hypothetical protein VMY42_14205, partial [Thermoguttaceae bacterium]|nr:hypothetical protein [Thermoguttaceae bacterium]
FTADAPGTAVFEADPADLSPDHDTFVFDDDFALSPARIALLDALLEITESAESESSVPFSDLADQAFADVDDWLT